MKRTILYFGLLLCLLAAPLHAQSDWQKLINGQSNYIMPATFGELTPKWHHLNVDYLHTLRKEAGSIPVSLSQALKLPVDCYSLGEIVTLNSQKMLVACAPRIPSPVLTAVSNAIKRTKTGTDPEQFIKTFLPKADSSTPLEVILIPLDQISSFIDIGPFDPADIAARRITLDTFTMISAASVIPTFAHDRVNELHSEHIENLRMIGSGISMYAREHNQRLPRLKDLSTLKKDIISYVNLESAFTAPDSKIKYRTNPYTSQKSLKFFPSPERIVVVYENAPTPGKLRAVLYLDGYSTMVSETQWRSIKQESHIP